MHSCVRRFLSTACHKYEQTFYFIRHGTTEMNEILKTMEWGTDGFTDVALWDTRLSAAGLSQTIELHETWRKQCLPEADAALRVIPWDKIDLVLCSPLSRALQTYTSLVQHAMPPLIDDQVPKVVHPLLRERLYLASDTGSGRSVLESNFPHFNFSLLPKDDSAWWYTIDNNNVGTEFATEEGGDVNNSKEIKNANTSYEEWRPGHPSSYLCPGEPGSVFKLRLEYLRRVLLTRPERHILVVAHWGVLRGLTGHDFRNCEVKIVKADALLEESIIDS
ncbi:phosphatase [Acrasis kona]|uniref:Phosphatase n=1 Tax=Acrasis kona TaxID=1008807 RepID=A0AAW2ZH22_9EUKA